VVKDATASDAQGQRKEVTVEDIEKLTPAIKPASKAYPVEKLQRLR
jgi:hypothetical protein